MKASKFAEKLRDELRQLSINGQKTLDTNNMAQYLDESIPDLVLTDATDQEISVNYQTEYYKAVYVSQQQMFDSVISYGKEALKSALLINAGGAVALLTYFGNFHGTAHSRVLIGCALLLLTVGVLAAAMAFGGSYLTQFFYSERRLPMGKRFHWATVVFALASYVLFFAAAVMTFLGLE